MILGNITQRLTHTFAQKSKPEVHRFQALKVKTRGHKFELFVEGISGWQVKNCSLTDSLPSQPAKI